jgi:hypothetical protein
MKKKVVKEIKDESEIIENVEEKNVKEFNELSHEEKVFLINKKVKEKQELSFEETKFVENVNEQIKQSELEEEIKQRELDQDIILKEYAEAAPSEKLTAEQVAKNSVRVGGGGFLQKIFVNLALRNAAKKGGSLLLKVYRDSAIEIIWSKTPVRFVEFVEPGEISGETIKHISRVTKTKHRLKGSSIPIHIICEGVFENLNLYGDTETNLSSEYLNRMSISYFQAGLSKGLGLRTSNDNFLASLQPLMPIILIVGLLVIGWISMQMYGEMTALRAAVEASKNLPAAIIVGP